MTTIRQIRIYLAIRDDLVLKAIKNFLSKISDESTHVYVEILSEADLVIFTNVQDIEKDYTEEKTYALLKPPGLRIPPLPGNFTVIDPLRIIADLRNTITNVSKKIAPDH